MTRTAKEEMKQDAQKANVCKRLVRELHISVSESKRIVDGLIAKYGDNAFEVIKASMERPYDALGAIGESGRTSRRTLKFFLEKDLTTEQLKKALGADKVKTNTKLKGELKAEAKAAKTNKKELPQNLATRQQKLDTKTKTATAKKKGVTDLTKPFDFSKGAPKIEDWANNSWMVKTADEKANDAYEKAMGGRIAGNLTFDELAKSAGVKKEDLQALINQQKTIEKKGALISSIIPGKTREAFAREADDVSGRCGGKCLTGVQEMAVGVYGSDAKSPINGMRPEWKTDVEKAKGDSANSACNAHVLFDRVGSGLTVTVPNLAYGERAGSLADKKMKEFNDRLPGGTIGSTSHKRNAKGYAANQSARHGHIWVKDHDGNSCSDGVQKNGPKDFNAYGPEVYVTLFRDDYVPKELALDLIKQAQKRQEMEQQRKQAKVAQR